MFPYWCCCNVETAGCCLPNGQCINTSHAGCLAQGGVPFVQGLQCSQVPQPPCTPPGACICELPNVIAVTVAASACVPFHFCNAGGAVNSVITNLQSALVNFMNGTHLLTRFNNCQYSVPAAEICTALGNIGGFDPCNCGNRFGPAYGQKIINATLGAGGVGGSWFVSLGFNVRMHDHDPLPGCGNPNGQNELCTNTSWTISVGDSWNYGHPFQPLAQVCQGASGLTTTDNNNGTCGPVGVIGNFANVVSIQNVSVTT